MCLYGALEQAAVRNSSDFPWPVPISPQLIIELSQLAKEPDIGLDLPGLSHQGEGLSGRHAFLLHQVGHDDGCRPGVTQQAVDKHFSGVTF